MLKDGAEILAESILQIANMLFDSMFIEGIEKAKLTPIFKNRKTTEPKNYRPVSLLLHFTSLLPLLERVVHNQLI